MGQMGKGAAPEHTFEQGVQDVAHDTGMHGESPTAEAHTTCAYIRYFGGFRVILAL